MYYLKYPSIDADIYSIERRCCMLTLAMILGMFVGYEGYDNGKLYIGTYTPTCEYGWVITDSEIYLDTIYEKNNIFMLDN